MQKLLVALLLSATVLAGCVNGSDSTDDLPYEPTPGSYPVEFVNPIMQDHDHNDAANYAAHDIANNMAEVAYHPLREGNINTISEIDAAGDYVFVAEMGYGFHVYDVSDPLDPILLNSVDIQSPDDASPLGLYMADLKVDATGDWVFVATELSTTPGVLIYDARDKSDITLAGFWPEPGLLLGCHMIEYFAMTDGETETEYLACAPLDNAVYIGMILPPAGPVREIVQVARWMPETPEFASQQGAVVEDHVNHFIASIDPQVNASAFDPNDPTSITDAIYAANPSPLASAATHFVSGHQDMTFQIDAITGTPMLTASFWNLGLHWIDVTTPALPLSMGAWYGVDSENYAGNLHTAMLYFEGDERHAVAIPEGAQPPTMFVMDATEFNAPELTAEWSVKDTEGNNSRFSMHNFQIVDGKVYLTMYHGGIWVLDVHGEEMRHDPAVLGTYMPFDRRPDTYGRGLNGGIMSWDLVVVDGYIMTANQGGFFVLALEDDPLGDPEATSFA